MLTLLRAIKKAKSKIKSRMFFRAVLQLWPCDYQAA